MGRKKFLSEKETIRNVLQLAREQGVEDKVKSLILKFQDAIKGAKNEMSRRQIATLGIAEIYKTIGCVGGLVVDGIDILPPETAYQEAIDLHKGVVRMD